MVFSHLVISFLFYLSELLSQRYHAVDLAPNVSIFGFHPGGVNSEVLGLDVFINRCKPGCSWTSSWSPPLSWGSECSGYDAVMIFRWGCTSKVTEKP